MNKGIVASISAVGVFCLTTGLTLPLLSLVLENMGQGSTMIGLNAAMGSLGIIVSAPFITQVSRRYGAWFVCVASLCLTALLLVLLGAMRNVWIWFPLRFLLGVAINAIFVLSESWINQLAVPEKRGRTIGIYNTVAAAGFALGPLVLMTIGSQGWAPFLVGIAGALLALPVFYLARHHLPEFNDKHRASVFSFVSIAPLLLLAVGCAALFDLVTLSLLPIYALQHGYAEKTAALILGVSIVGNVLLQLPIGWLADRYSRQHLICVLSFMAVAGCILLPLLIGRSIWLWPMLFVWGSISYGTYTVALVELGDRFSGTLLLAGNGAFAIMWGISGVFGTPFAGFAMQLWGPEGLPATLAVVFIFLGIAAFRRPLCRISAD